MDGFPHTFNPLRRPGVRPFLLFGIGEETALLIPFPGRSAIYADLFSDVC